MAGKLDAVSMDSFWIKSVTKERRMAAQSKVAITEWKAMCLSVGMTPKELGIAEGAAGLAQESAVELPDSARNLPYRTSNKAYGSLARSGYIALLPKDPGAFVYDGYDKAALRRDPVLSHIIPKQKS